MYVDCVPFLDQELITYRYLSCSSCCCRGQHSPKKPKSPLFQIGWRWNLAGLFLKLIHVDWWSLTFRFDITLSRLQPWHHFTQKSAAIWWVHTAFSRRICSRVSQLPTSTSVYSSWSIVLSYLFIVLIADCMQRSNWWKNIVCRKFCDEVVLYIWCCTGWPKLKYPSSKFVISWQSFGILPWNLQHG